MVYLGILDTRKFLGSQKILTELTAVLSQIWSNYKWYNKNCCVQEYFSEFLGIFLWKCHIPLLDRKCLAIFSIILSFIIQETYIYITILICFTALFHKSQRANLLQIIAQHPRLRLTSILSIQYYVATQMITSTSKLITFCFLVLWEDISCFPDSSYLQMKQNE